MKKMEDMQYYRVIDVYRNDHHYTYLCVSSKVHAIRTIIVE